MQADCYGHTPKAGLQIRMDLLLLYFFYEPPVKTASDSICGTKTEKLLYRIFNIVLHAAYQTGLLMYREDPRFYDSVCYQTFCCKIEFAVIKKLEMDQSKA